MRNGAEYNFCMHIAYHIKNLPFMNIPYPKQCFVVQTYGFILQSLFMHNYKN